MEYIFYILCSIIISFSFLSFSSLFLIFSHLTRIYWIGVLCVKPTGHPNRAHCLLQAVCFSALQFHAGARGPLYHFNAY